MQTRIYDLNRGRAAIEALVCFVMAALFFWVLRQQFTHMKWDSFSVFCIFISMFLLASISLFCLAFSYGPAMILSPAGIQVSRVFLGTVPWTEVEKIIPIRSENSQIFLSGRMYLLRLKVDAAYSDKITWKGLKTIVRPLVAKSNKGHITFNLRYVVGVPTEIYHASQLLLDESQRQHASR